jgi:phage terminase Nu1 subunit (DNA packaging protein)
MAKAKPGILWTIEQAAREFGADRDTLSRLLTREGIRPDENGHFATTQICAAIFGDIDAEKVGLTRAQRIKEETANRKRAGELVEVEAVIELAQRFCFAARQKILLSSMPETEKQALLLDIGRLADVDYSQIEPDEKEPGS